MTQHLDIQLVAFLCARPSQSCQDDIEATIEQLRQFQGWSDELLYLYRHPRILLRKSLDDWREDGRSYRLRASNSNFPDPGVGHEFDGSDPLLQFVERCEAPFQHLAAIDGRQDTSRAAIK